MITVEIRKIIEYRIKFISSVLCSNYMFPIHVLDCVRFNFLVLSPIFDFIRLISKSHTLINITTPSSIVYTIYYIRVLKGSNGCKFLCLTKRLGKYVVLFLLLRYNIQKSKVVLWVNRPTRFLRMIGNILCITRK